MTRFAYLGAIVGVGAALAVATSAAAGLPVTLKPEASDADGLVTMGDIFDGAGSAGVIAVARRTGSSVVLDAGAVQMAARRAGLDWANAEGIRRIIVRGGAVGAAAQAGNVSVLTYARDFAAGEIVRPEDVVWTKLAARPAGAPRDADAVIGMAARRPLREGAPVSTRDVSAPQVIKAGDLVSVTWSDGAVSVTLQGKALQNAAAGEVVRPEDVVWTKLAARPAGAPRDADAVIGMAARRPLREGAPVSTRDVSAPQVIKAGDLVSVTWSDGAVSVTLQGKALQSAAAGEAFGVQNTASKKTLQAVASGPGQAVVGPAADQMKMARSTRYAVR